jgi:hypothetical protein
VKPADYQSQADARVAEAIEGLEPDEAAHMLAALASRAATRLHGLTRTEATARKGQPTWPTWAALQNAARTLVLHSSTCRDLAARLSKPNAAESATPK